MTEFEQAAIEALKSIATTISSLGLLLSLSGLAIVIALVAMGRR